MQSATTINKLRRVVGGGRQWLAMVAVAQLFITIIKGETDGNEAILSRQRRYLVFPSGSSLQLGKKQRVRIEKRFCICISIMNFY